MKRLMLCSLMIIGTFSGNLIPLRFIQIAHAEKPIPPYAKWGTLAMEKTKEKYPNAKIIDYLHIGKVTGAHSSTEKFKLWLRDNSREFGVFVDIEFNNRTEKVIKISFKESNR